MQNTLQIGLSFATSSVVVAYAANALPVTGLIMEVCVVGILPGYSIANLGLLKPLRLPDTVHLSHFDNQNEF